MKMCHRLRGFLTDGQHPLWPAGLKLEERSRFQGSALSATSHMYRIIRFLRPIVTHAPLFSEPITPIGLKSARMITTPSIPLPLSMLCVHTEITSLYRNPEK